MCVCVCVYGYIIHVSAVYTYTEKLFPATKMRIDFHLEYVWQKWTNAQRTSGWVIANITATHGQPGFGSWECKHDRRETRRNDINDVFPKEILGENHVREVSNLRHAN